MIHKWQKGRDRPLSKTIGIFFFLRFIAQKVCTACPRKSYRKIVPLTILNKYLHNDTSETEVNINIGANNGSEKLLKKKNTAISGKLITAVYASYVKFIFFVQVSQVG